MNMLLLLLLLIRAIASSLELLNREISNKDPESPHRPLLTIFEHRRRQRRLSGANVVAVSILLLAIQLPWHQLDAIPSHPAGRAGWRRSRTSEPANLLNMHRTRRAKN
ncbi:hypothetical protein SEVIR_4G290750v4 [Setaria viridis]